MSRLITRHIQSFVANDLKKKMVFVGGPRQVGKTTLAKELMTSNGAYLSWDDPTARTQILKNEIPSSEVLVFDELHKYHKWRNWIKGLYDTSPKSRRILVTGSARLDYYRYGGDSLQGRYHYWRLHPFALDEVGLKQSDLEQLFMLGGFPEPFLSGSEQSARRWSREYRVRLVEQDITQIETISEISTLELLMSQLPDLVGSPLSINSLREDLEKNHKTISRWLDVLERFYAIFRISPYGPPRLRAVKKEQKHYQYDWSLVSNKGARFENLLALHLLRWVNFRQDWDGRDVELRYYRDNMGREVDFVIVEKKKILALIEAKFEDHSVSPSLEYLKERTRVPLAYQVNFSSGRDFVNSDGVRVLPARTFLKELADGEVF